MLHLTGQRTSYMAELYLLRISTLDRVTRMLVAFFALYVSSTCQLIRLLIDLEPACTALHVARAAAMRMHCSAICSCV